jgi:hypothetical protein
MERQLHIKSLDSNSWFMEIKKLCIKYNLEDPINYMQNYLSKTKWKSLITSAIYKYWNDRINEEIKYYSTLKYLSPTYEIGKIHPLAKTNTVLEANICTSIEPLCRQLIYKLHCKRYELLAKNDLLRCKRKINISA